MSQHPALASGRVAVITGAASGIGLSAARRFAELGMKVVLSDYNTDMLSAAATSVASLAANGQSDIRAIRADVSRLEDVQHLRDETYRAFGEVALLMNNAGTAPGGGPWDHIDRWRTMLEVNLWGVIHGVHTFAQAMIDQGTPGAPSSTRDRNRA